MELKELQKHWNLFGKRDPLWAILMWNDKKDNKWNPDEFFETGKQEIKDVMQLNSRWGCKRWSIDRRGDGIGGGDAVLVNVRLEGVG